MNVTISPIRQGYQKRKRRYCLITFLLFLLVLCLAFMMLSCGDTFYPLTTVFRVLSGEKITGAVFPILTLRLPRMCAAILCGIAFGMAGNTFQMLLKNPLASPDLIGVTSGSSAAAVFGILILNMNRTYVSLLAVFFGILTAFFIYFLSNHKGFSTGKLILTGIGMQAFLNALISFMLLKASEYDVASALRWLSGSLSGIRLDSIPKLAIVVLFAGSSILLMQRHLQILQLGDSYGTTLGAKVTILRLFLIFFAILLIAFATSVTGPIASVAFLSGSIAAKLCGKGQTNMLSSAFLGAILVSGSDLIGQFLLPSRYPVGVVTGMLGAPYLLFLLLYTNKKGGKLS